MSSATASINRRWLDTNFPCRAACPVGTNAGGYVSLVAQGRYEEAYHLARRPNPLASICGKVCSHPCEAACRRGEIDQPIAIRALKGFVCDRFGVESVRNFDEILKVVERPRPPAPKPGRIAIVGAGPAGLACAHDLALMGHQAVIYDAAPVAGGMLRLGIPPYRLPRELIDCEVDFIRHLGVEIRLGVEIGRDIPFESLVRDHDAVFLAPGCRRGRKIPIPGADLPGVIVAVDLLAAVNLDAEIDIGERVVVVGGGNVAYDVARSVHLHGGTSVPDEEHHRLMVDSAFVASRTLKRRVTVVALESRDEMPADDEEIEEASAEGVRMINRRSPRAVLAGPDGRARALQTLDVSRVFDERGRFAPETIPGTEREIEADTVVLAIGQAADLSFLGEGHGLRLSPRSTIEVDRATLATSRAGIFAGGDVAFGPRIAIEAVADGRRAARAIDTHLTGRVDEAPRTHIRVFDTFGYDHPFARGDYETIPRGRVPTLPVERRALRRQTELVYEEEQARLEGSRCLRCWINTVVDSSALDGTECIQCQGCADVCPMDCFDLVAMTRVARGEEVRGALRLPDGSPFRPLFDRETGAALIKDETACIRCGLCARRCPVQCITMQGFYRTDEAEIMRGAEVIV
ncbi:MAG: FAD-dependent oxidoreductase [Planctomycetes bacterium]|nr:FAD-dependent oxidoreductase [Planctomycetota bacterium]